jgi:hypothetical protein
MSKETVSSRILVALSFVGGSYIIVLLLAPWLWSKRSLAVVLLLGLATSACARWLFTAAYRKALHMAIPFDVSSALQFGLLASVGVLVLWLALEDLARNQSADAFLLTLWVFGTFAFAGFVNWTCNVRSLLPLTPALGILMVRRIEHGFRSSIPRTSWRWALVPAVSVSLVIAWADLCLANSARMAAKRVAETLRSERGHFWFQGHWGFQYYMNRQGGRAVDLANPHTLPGEIMIVPSNNTNVFFYDSRFFDGQHELEFPACPWLATLQERVGAGFYSAIWGPMPFVFGPTPTEKYAVCRLNFELLPKVTAPDRQ